MVRTRYAPSPSGLANLAGTRSALMAYAYAKKNKGEFWLRIEDTAKDRSFKDCLIDIMENMQWLGIKWDHGPKLEDVKNDIYDPECFQSKQVNIYNRYIQKLLDENKAYENPDKSVVFRMPVKDYIANDILTGEYTLPSSEVKDFVIRRANGDPVFHITNPISDAIEGMTVLIKGADHKTNLFKHIAIFEALGFEVPQVCHLSLILDDKGEKISKRRGDQGANLTELRKDGFLPEAIVNIMGLLGWSAPDGREEFDLNYICENFDLKDCVKSNPRYDFKKLVAFNSKRLREMSFQDFHTRLWSYGEEFYPEKAEIIGLMGKAADFTSAYLSKIKKLSDAWDNVDFLFEISYNNKVVEKHLLKNDNEGLKTLELILPILENLKWNKESLMAAIKDFVQTSKLSMNKVSQAIRVSCVGGEVSPSIDATLDLLGKEKTINRIKGCLEKFAAGVN